MPDRPDRPPWAGRTHRLERLRNEINLSVADFTDEHAAAAQRAFLQYGKGRHRAALNFGDCMTYAAARVSHEPLVAIGSDFSVTDIDFKGGVIGYWLSSDRA